MRSSFSSRKSKAFWVGFKSSRLLSSSLKSLLRLCKAWKQRLVLFWLARKLSIQISLQTTFKRRPTAQLSFRKSLQTASLSLFELQESISKLHTNFQSFQSSVGQIASSIDSEKIQSVSKKKSKEAEICHPVCKRASKTWPKECWALKARLSLLRASRTALGQLGTKVPNLLFLWKGSNLRNSNSKAGFFRSRPSSQVKRVKKLSSLETFGKKRPSS